MAEPQTMLSRSGAKTEVRFEVEQREVSVLDGFCSATGRSRTDVIKELLREWSEKELHRAMIICRVAGVNPTRPDGGRSE